MRWNDEQDHYQAGNPSITRACNPLRDRLQSHSVIKGFKHKGLERFFRKGVKSGIQARHMNRLKLILGRLHASTSAKDMDLPGLNLHKLTGKRQDTWAVSVSGNWRMTFRFRGKDAEDVDYEDYH